jgi:hypothetical protein
MDQRGVILLFICVLISLYLKVFWLGIMLIAVLVLASIGDIKRPAPRMVAVPKGGGAGGGSPQQVLYPVIYEDVGAPYLYSPKRTRIKVVPMWEPDRMFERAAKGVGHIGGSIFHAISGGREE